jgi:hypothetical protein
LIKITALNKELRVIEDYNRRLTNRYASILAALLVIWAAFCGGCLVIDARTE